MPWKELSQLSASPRASENAKLLRRSMTGPERRLWRHLRNRLPIAGSHFRRQVALGSYVVDFCCLSERLIIEVDGEQHGHEHQKIYDEVRTAALVGQGYRVLRFTNTDVMHRIDGVLDTILATLAIPSLSTHGPAECGA